MGDHDPRRSSRRSAAACAGGRTFKAVQVGGPSGGCVPAALADTPVDYEALIQRRRDHGLAADWSCWTTPIAWWISRGTSSASRRTSRAASAPSAASAPPHAGDSGPALRRQGRRRGPDRAGTAGRIRRAAAASAVSARRHPIRCFRRCEYFRDEYEAHLAGRCPAGKCTDADHVRINDRCIGCTLCAQQCPVDAIPMTAYRRHQVNHDICTRCDTCRQVCPENAIDVR